MSIAERDLTIGRYTQEPQPRTSSVADDIKAQKITVFFPWACSLIAPMSSFSSDWDGYGALAPSIDAMRYAAFHLAYIRGAHKLSLEPEVEPLANGGVNLEWHNGPNTLTIEIYSDGEAQFLYRDNVEGSPRTGRYQVSYTPPNSLLASLRLMT